MNYNQVTLVGRVGADPEVKALASGTMVANFRVAVSERFKDKSGKQQERTDWFTVEAWAKLAELCGQYVKKGSVVLVSGQLRNDEWEKDGKKQTKTKIVAQNVTFGPKPAGSEPTPAGASGDEDLPF